MSWMKWLGFEDQIQLAMAPTISSIEQRLAKLAESQETLKEEVARIKALVDGAVRRNSRD
jgi:hypothetical protein